MFFLLLRMDSLTVFFRGRLKHFGNVCVGELYLAKFTKFPGGKAERLLAKSRAGCPVRAKWAHTSVEDG